MRTYYTALAAFMAAVVLPVSLTAQSATSGAVTKTKGGLLRSIHAVQHVPAIADELRGGGPANDDCAGAVAQNLAVGGTATFTGDNTGATVDISSGGTDFTFVWEAFTITECATVTVNYCVAGSVFTNFMINLTTSCPDILTGLIQTSDYDDCSATFANLAAGTWYIPVLVQAGNTPAGAYTIEASAVACPLPPANDDCANATEIGDGVHAFSSEGATGTDITSCTSGDSNDVWFVYTATCTGIATASTCDDVDFDSSVSVWAACGGMEIACNDDGDDCSDFTSEVTFSVVAGTSYWIRVAGYQGETGSGNLTVSCDGSISAPANDDCANATEIGDGTHAFSSANATGTDISSCTSGDGNDIWFEYVATCSGQVTAGTCSDADFDTSVSVWAACGGTQLACNDDDANCDGNTSVVTFMATSGTSYWIRVAGYNGATGTGNLTVSCDGSVTSPVNDNCANATSLTVNAPADCPANAVEGDNSVATQDGGDPDCDTTTGQFLDVWYAFNSGDYTTVTINIGVGTMEDLVLEVLDGCAGASVYCDFGNVTNEVTVTENTDYLVRVMSNTEYGNGGTFTICITGEEEGPTNDYCTAGASGVGLGLEERIINVTFSNINNNSPNVSPVAPAYQDFTSVVGNVTTGQSYSIAVDVARDGANTSYSENQVLVWIDFDQNGDFAGAGELVYTSAIGSVDIYEGNIAIPANATLGMTRMRVRLHDTHNGSQYTNNFNNTPCGLASYGEVEDYNLNIDFGTAVQEGTAANWSVFPNPNNGDFTISSGNESGKVQVEVLDMTGRLVNAEQRYMVRGEQTTFNMAGRLAAGTYVLRLTSEAGRYEQRIVVR